MEARRVVPPIAISLLVLWTIYLAFGTTNGFAFGPSWHNEQRAAQLILLLLTGAAFVVFTLSGRTRALPRAVWLFLAFGTVSAAFTPFARDGLAEVALISALAGLAVFTSVVATSLHANRVAQLLALLIAACHVVGMLVRYVTALSLGDPIGNDVLLLGYANPRFQSALYGLLLPLIGALIVDPNRGRWERPAAVVVASLLWAMNLALGTRAVFIAYLVGGVVLAALLGWRLASRFIVPQCVTMLLGLVLFLALFVLLPELLAEQSKFQVRTQDVFTLNGRQFLLASSWQAIASAPWLGIGPMQFAAIPNVWAAHPHNWILQIAVEFGVPMAIAVSAAVLWFLTTSAQKIKAARSPAAVHAVAPFAVVVVALIYGLADGIFVMPVSQSVAAIALGLLIGQLRMLEDRPAGTAEKSQRLGAVATAMVVLFSATYLAAYALLTFPEQQAGVREYKQRFGEARFLVPRFWEQGLLLQRDPPLRAHE